MDPIDGTTNFLHSFPITCVSIGLCHHGIPVVGVVVAPALQEVYVGVRGHGAYLNGKRLGATKVTKIKDALLLTELSYLREGAVQDNFFNCLKAVLDEKPHSLRMLGSGVLNLCYVRALYSGPSSFSSSL